MKTLIFLDDERFMFDATWVEYPDYEKKFVVRDFDQFKDLLDELLIDQQDLSNLEISFDHDLACFDRYGTEYTGVDCARYLVDKIIDLNLNPNYLVFYVHSMNPIGKENICGLIQGYIKFYNNGE